MPTGGSLSLPSPTGLSAAIRRLVDRWSQLVDRRLGSAIRRICFGSGAVRAHLLPVTVTTAREPPSDGLPDATALGTANPPQGFCGQ